MSGNEFAGDPVGETGPLSSSPLIFEGIRSGFWGDLTRVGFPCIKRDSGAYYPCISSTTEALGPGF